MEIVDNNALKAFVDHHRDKIELGKRLKANSPLSSQAGWNNRQPIGITYFSQVSYRTEKNPRGWNPWFYDQKWSDPLDIKDPNFQTKFEERWKWFVQDAITICLKYGCQGMLIWDVEGQQHDHAISYIGDPLMCPPEVTRNMVKWMVDECAKNNLWVGFTLRASIAYAVPHSKSYDLGHDATQFPCGIVAHNMVYKMNLMNILYGPNVKCAYWDSNLQVDAWINGRKEYNFNVVNEIQTLRPGWLLIPEFVHQDYKKIPRVVPLRFPLQPSEGMPQLILPTPDASVPSDEQLAQYVLDMKAGSIPAISATWDYVFNNWMYDCYKKSLV